MDDLITQLRALSGDPRLSELVDTILSVRNQRQGELPMKKAPGARALDDMDWPIPTPPEGEDENNINPRTGNEYSAGYRYGGFNKGPRSLPTREGTDYEPASGRSKGYDRDYDDLVDFPKGRRGYDDSQRELKSLNAKMDEEYYYLVDRARKEGLTSQERARFAELARRLDYDPNVPHSKHKKRLEDQMLEDAKK